MVDIDRGTIVPASSRARSQSPSNAIEAFMTKKQKNKLLVDMYKKVAGGSGVTVMVDIAC